MLYKHPCGLYVEDAKPWQLEQFRQDGKAKGDIIYNTCRKIIDDDDRLAVIKTPWYYNALSICADLLLRRVRWPDEFNHPNDAKNIFQYWISKWRYDCGLSSWRLMRPQTNMTRDPFIYFYALCVHLDRLQFIEVVTIPLHLFRLKTWLWRKALITGKRNKLYEWLETSKDHKLEYAQLLKHYRMKAYETRVLKQ